jgi:hypothetical protein
LVTVVGSQGTGTNAVACDGIVWIVYGISQQTTGAGVPGKQHISGPRTITTGAQGGHEQTANDAIAPQTIGALASHAFCHLAGSLL